MAIAIYRKKYIIKKTGEIKVYSYSKESSNYSSKSYKRKKELHPRIQCDTCKRMVYEFYMSKHKTSRTCEPKNDDFLGKYSPDDPKV